MSAYLVAQIEITDPDLFKKYSAQVTDVVARHGGRYLVRGGARETLEGSPPERRTVIIAFDDREAALRWYNSEDYAPLLALRQKASRGDLILVDGV